MRGAAAATRPRNECVFVGGFSRGLACVFVRSSCVCGRLWASSAVEAMAAWCWAACFGYLIAVLPMQSARGQLRSLISAAVCAWLAPQGIRDCISVIIRQLFRDLGTKLKVDIGDPHPIGHFYLRHFHQKTPVGLQQCLRYGERGLNTAYFHLSPRH